MVMRHAVSILMLLPVSLLLVCLAGCSPGAKVRVPEGFRPADQSTVYVAPFIATLVPDTVSEPLFNDFVDTLNRNRTIPGITFFAIIKDDLKDVDPAWLQKQLYITGELWSYIEKSGCCSTEIRMKSRINIHQPGQQSSAEIEVPKEVFFEHDRASVEEEREKFARELAAELSRHVISVLDRKE